MNVSPIRLEVTTSPEKLHRRPSIDFVDSPRSVPPTLSTLSATSALAVATSASKSFSFPLASSLPASTSTFKLTTPSTTTTTTPTAAATPTAATSGSINTSPVSPNVGTPLVSSKEPSPIHRFSVDKPIPVSFNGVEVDPPSRPQKRVSDKKQAKRWAHEAMRKAALHPLCKVVMCLASLTSLAETVIVSGVLVDSDTSSGVQWGLLTFSIVLFVELLREARSTFKVVSNVEVSLGQTIRALLMPGEVQLELYCLIWGVIFLGAYQSLAPLRIWRVLRIFWYVDVFSFRWFQTPKKIASFVVVFCEKIGQELATRAGRGTWIVIAFYFFTLYVFAVVFRLEAQAIGLEGPVNITNHLSFPPFQLVNMATGQPWVGRVDACDSLNHCFFTMMRLSLLDRQGFDFIANLIKAEYPALVALAILFLTFSAVVILNGLLGIQRAVITAQVASESEKPVQNTRASPETIRDILVHQAEVLDDIFQYIPHAKGAPLKLTNNIPLNMSRDELAGLCADALTQLKQKGWFFRFLLIGSASICLAELVLIALPETLVGQEILLAVASALFIVIIAIWACKVRDMSKGGKYLTMGTIMMGLLSSGEIQLEIGCFIIGWVGLYYDVAFAALRVFRIVRMLWFLEFKAPDKHSIFYSIKKIVFQVTQFAGAIGTELFSLRSKGGIVVLGFFFYAAYLFGIVFWLVHQLPEFAPTQTWWTGEVKAPCETLPSCFFNLLRLSLFDTQGFDFLVDMSYSPYPILGALAMLYMCFTSFMLINGMIGIFGATFAHATQVSPLTECVQPNEREPGVLFLMGNGRILRSSEKFAFPLPPASPEMEGVHQILEMLELERRLEIQLLPKQQIIRRWNKAIEVARTTSMFTLLTLCSGVLSICEAALVAFPEYYAAQLAILVMSSVVFVSIEHITLDAASKACPEVSQKMLMSSFASSVESRLDLFGLIFGWVFFFSLPQLAALRAIRVFRVMWVLQKHPSVRPLLKKIAYLIVNYIEAVYEEFTTNKTNGGIIVLGYYFFMTYIFSAVLYAEILGDTRFRFVPTPGGTNMHVQWFFLVMRISLYDTVGLSFLREAVEYKPAVGVLGFLYLVLSSVILLNGLLGIFGNVFAESTNDEAEKDDSEVEEMLFTKHTDEHIVLREQAKILQSIQTLLTKLLPTSAHSPLGDTGAAFDTEHQRESLADENLPQYEYSAAVFRACESWPFKLLLLFSWCLSIVESVLVGFDLDSGIKAAQIAVLALSSLTLIVITIYINYVLRDVVIEGWSSMLMISLSSIGVKFEIGCLIYGWACIFAHPAAAPLRCLRVVCMLWYIKAGTYDRQKNQYVNAFGRLASLGVQYFESVTREFFSPHTRGSPAILLLFFFSIYIYGCVLWYATAGLPQTCGSVGQCFQTMLYLTFHDSQSFDFLLNLVDGPFPGLALLTIVFMIFAHFVFLNCLIGVFASAFDNRERQQKVNEVEKYEALLQRGFETLSPREVVLDKLRFFVKQDAEAELAKKANLFGEGRFEELRQAFNGYSAGRFRVACRDFARLYRSLTQEVNVSQAALQDMISEYDPAGEGSILFTHFLAAMAKHQERLDIRAETTNTFKKYDVDGDGSVSALELNNCMNEMKMKFNSDQLDEILREADINGDGRVDYDEFVDMILA